jgi:hypothetical protein
VVVEDLLGASRRCHVASPFGSGCGQPRSLTGKSVQVRRRGDAPR